MSRPFERLQQLLTQAQEARREIAACSHTWSSHQERTGPYQMGVWGSMHEHTVFAVFRKRTCVKCGLVQEQTEVTPGSPAAWKDKL